MKKLTNLNADQQLTRYTLESRLVYMFTEEEKLSVISTYLAYTRLLKSTLSLNFGIYGGRRVMAPYRKTNVKMTLMIQTKTIPQMILTAVRKKLVSHMILVLHQRRTMKLAPVAHLNAVKVSLANLTIQLVFF